MATMTAQAFNRDVSAAKRLADEEPLFITQRGEPKFVLMTIAEYERMKPPAKTLLEVFQADDDIDLAELIPPRTIGDPRIQDFER